MSGLFLGSFADLRGSSLCKEEVIKAETRKLNLIHSFALRLRPSAMRQEAAGSLGSR